MYCYIKENGRQKIVIKNDLKHQDHKNALLNSKQMFHKMKTMRSDRH